MGISGHMDYWNPVGAAGLKQSLSLQSRIPASLTAGQWELPNSFQYRLTCRPYKGCLNINKEQYRVFAKLLFFGKTRLTQNLAIVI